MLIDIKVSSCLFSFQDEVLGCAVRFGHRHVRDVAGLQLLQAPPAGALLFGRFW